MNTIPMNEMHGAQLHNTGRVSSDKNSPSYPVITGGQDLTNQQPPSAVASPFEIPAHTGSSPIDQTHLQASINYQQANSYPADTLTANPANYINSGYYPYTPADYVTHFNQPAFYSQHYGLGARENNLWRPMN